MTCDASNKSLMLCDMSSNRPDKSKLDSNHNVSFGTEEASDDVRSPEELADIDQPIETGNTERENGVRDSIDNEDEYDLVEDEEFSLDQLSQAYATVLKNQIDPEQSDQDNVKSPDSVANASDVDSSDAVESEAVETDNDGMCPVSPETIIESILFVGAPQGVKLTSRKVAAVLRDVSPKEVTTIVRQLNARYEKENTAYRIESEGGVFRMVLDPALNDFQQEFFGRNRQFRLSQASIDVMAIVAYNQPTTREQVEKTRGKPSGSILSQLVRRQLLLVEPGETNPKVRYFSTTDRFLGLFGLSEIEDLPQSHEISDIDDLVD